MRITALLLSLILIGPAATLRAQNPGAQQDAQAAREKLLKAADQLDNIQANSETTRTSVDNMKGDVSALQATVTKLQSDNAALQQRVAELQAELDADKAQQAKDRQALIDNVAAMIADKSPAKKTTKKKTESGTTAEPKPSAPVTSSGPVKTPSNLAPPPDAPPAVASADDNINPPAPPPPKPQKGYYHVVASGETLKLIVEAYRDNGVKTTAAAIRKANGLTEDSVLKPGQKLFIPKPGA